ncbi:MAG: hypothetical protein NC218_01070 [Acetobacter sp.]|nr:hypothetical protein [Acetobacter sp.]
MKKVLSLLILCMWGIVAQAAEIKSDSLGLTKEQSQKLTEMQEQLKAEIQPIWDEVESGRNRIIEIEKKYFQEFWNMLTEEQKQKFADLQR